MTWFMAQYNGSEPDKWQTVWADDLGHAAATVAVEALKPKLDSGELKYPARALAYAADMTDMNRHLKPPHPPICVSRFELILTAPTKSRQPVGSSP